MRTRTSGGVEGARRGEPAAPILILVVSLRVRCAVCGDVALARRFIPVGPAPAIAAKRRATNEDASVEVIDILVSDDLEARRGSLQPDAP